MGFVFREEPVTLLHQDVNEVILNLSGVVDFDPTLLYI